MTDSENNIFLNAALHYVREFGWLVFPLVPRRKTPLTPNGCKDATTDEAQIIAWWTQYPTANVGIATGIVSNLAVVDVDVHKGANSSDLLFGGLGEEIFQTLGIQTGGGGLQFYFLFPDFDLRNSASQLGKFIDVRGNGGYVVAPPSVHESGRSYELLAESDESSGLMTFPFQWIEKLKSLKNQPCVLSVLSSNGSPQTNGNGGYNASAAVSVPATGSGSLIVPPPFSPLVVPDSIASGARNDSLARIAGSLRRIDLTPAEIESTLHSVNMRVCVPPLDPAEVHKIAQSVSRYAPGESIIEVTEGGESLNADFENTLRAYLLGDFLDITFEELEILAFDISKKDIAILQAPTNAGKTTILRNAALSMACGRPFKPFYEGGRPIKLAYFDFESSAERAQPDLKQMMDSLTPEERELAKINFIFIPKGMVKGELFQFNRNESWVSDLITGNAVEFVFVDNVSAAYDLNDENSNAEVNKKVIKPLLKLAYKGDCAFLFAHHYGKGKNELESAGVHAGRGASNLQSLSQTVINMFGNVSKGEPITIECAKRKNNGGKEYRQVLELRDDRWFHETLIVPPPKKRTAYSTIREYLQEILYPVTISTAEVIGIFEDVFESNSIKKTLNELFKDGFIDRPKYGQYCGKDLTKKTDFQAQVKNLTKKSFYDKDSD